MLKLRRYSPAESNDWESPGRQNYRIKRGCYQEGHLDQAKGSLQMSENMRIRGMTKFFSSTPRWQDETDLQYSHRSLSLRSSLGDILSTNHITSLPDIAIIRSPFVLWDHWQALVGNALNEEGREQILASDPEWVECELSMCYFILTITCEVADGHFWCLYLLFGWLMMVKLNL